MTTSTKGQSNIVLTQHPKVLTRQHSHLQPLLLSLQSCEAPVPVPSLVLALRQLRLVMRLRLLVRPLQMFHLTAGFLPELLELVLVHVLHISHLGVSLLSVLTLFPEV